MKSPFTTYAYEKVQLHRSRVQTFASYIFRNCEKLFLREKFASSPGGLIIETVNEKFSSSLDGLIIESVNSVL